MKRLICGWFQIKRLEPSYCLSTIRRDWQSFNTRNMGRSPVGRNHALAYGMVAAAVIFTTEYPADFAGARVQLFPLPPALLLASDSIGYQKASPHELKHTDLPGYQLDFHF